MTAALSSSSFAMAIPKAELHVHLEGALEPELLFAIAKRNGIRLPQASVQELKNSYQFHNLQAFLDTYLEGQKVLRHEQDFYDLAWTYLQKAHAQGVVHTEICIEFQSYLDRGISIDAMLNGVVQACQQAEQQLALSSVLILAFLRHLDEESAFRALAEARRHRDIIAAVGLAGAEAGNPPAKFKRVFSRAAADGFRTAAHAGEEGPAAYIWEALDNLHVDRIDHGNHCVDDPALVAELARRQTPLTMCPLSNVKLHIIDALERHPLRALLQAGLLVTVNSDDPAYCGGYIGDNYAAVQHALSLTHDDIIQLAKNSFASAFVPAAKKAMFISQLNDFCRTHTQTTAG